MLASHQGDLFAGGQPQVSEFKGGRGPTRHQLDHLCWVDHASGWLPGGDTLFRALELALEWRRERRMMYDRIVDVPRLMADIDERCLARLPILKEIGESLSQHYGLDLRRGFAAFYRNGNDSVAWHNDRVDLRYAEHTAAIVSLGGPRRIMFRSKSGGPARSFTMASGDLLVQGGSIQHHWQHSVPKVRFAHPRISLMFFGHGLEMLPGTVSVEPTSVEPPRPRGPQHHRHVSHAHGPRAPQVGTVRERGPLPLGPVVAAGR